MRDHRHDWTDEELEAAERFRITAEMKEAAFRLQLAPNRAARRAAARANRKPTSTTVRRSRR